MTSDASARSAQLFLRALAIRYDHKLGLWVPIVWHLALRRDAEAMIELACWICETGKWPGDLGARSDAFSPADLSYRAFRLGNAHAAQHLAMACFNRRDLQGYRHWLRQGAN
jgi:hypothetical protein